MKFLKRIIFKQYYNYSWMSNLIAYKSIDFFYQIVTLDNTTIQIRIRDDLQKKIYKADIPRRDKKLYEGLDLFDKIYLQYIWNNKMPKELLTLNHDTFQIILKLNNIQKLFRLKYSIEEIGPSQEEIKLIKQMEKLTQEIMEKQIKKYSQLIQNISSSALKKFEKTQSVYLQRITSKAQEIQSRLQNFLINKISQTDSKFQHYMIQSNQHIEKNIKAAEQRLLETYSKIVDQQHLITMNLQKNIGYCNENINELSTNVKEIQTQFEGKVSQIEEQLKGLQSELKLKLDRKMLNETLQKLKIIELKPYTQLKQGTDHEQFMLNEKYSGICTNGFASNQRQLFEHYGKSQVSTNDPQQLLLKKNNQFEFDLQDLILKNPPHNSFTRFTKSHLE